MTGWHLLIATWSARILLALSAVSQLIAIIVGFLALRGGAEIAGVPVYAGIDLPNLLYVIPYRVYVPDCEALLGPAAVGAGLTSAGHIANVGYLLWLCAMSTYCWRVLRFRAPPVRIYQRPEDGVGLPVAPDVMEQARVAVTVHPYPRRQALFYIVLSFVALSLFGYFIRSGTLVNKLCQGAGDMVWAAILMPSVQIGAVMVLELLLVEIIAALFLTREA